MVHQESEQGRLRGVSVLRQGFRGPLTGGSACRQGNFGSVLRGATDQAGSLGCLPYLFFENCVFIRALPACLRPASGVCLFAGERLEALEADFDADCSEEQSLAEKPVMNFMAQRV